MHNKLFKLDEDHPWTQQFQYLLTKSGFLWVFNFTWPNSKSVELVKAWLIVFNYFTNLDKIYVEFILLLTIIIIKILLLLLLLLLITIIIIIIIIKVITIMIIIIIVITMIIVVNNNNDIQMSVVQKLSFWNTKSLPKYNMFNS